MSRPMQLADELNEELVARAEEIVKAMGGHAEQAGELSKAQLSRAVDVAREARSSRVFNNWLAYQAGREQSGEFWSHRIAGRELVDWVRETLTFIEERIGEQVPSDPECRREAVTESLVRFLGFLKRALVGRRYLTEGGGRP
ncbi:MAG: hypothetical protein ACUVTQ_09850 [Desulfotomaculales bacterium]